MSNAPPNPLASLLADMATQVSHRALSLDPACHDALTKLDGQILQLQCSMPQADAYLHIYDGQMNYFAGNVEQPHVLVRGPAPALIGWLLGNAPKPAEITIDGDLTTLESVRGVLRAYRPDVATPLADAFGEELAANLIGGLELGWRGLTSALQVAEREARATGQRFYTNDDAVADFAKRVDELRLRVDRLNARVHTVLDAHNQAERG